MYQLWWFRSKNYLQKSQKWRNLLLDNAHWHCETRIAHSPWSCRILASQLKGRRRHHHHHLKCHYQHHFHHCLILASQLKGRHHLFLIRQNNYHCWITIPNNRWFEVLNYLVTKMKTLIHRISLQGDDVLVFDNSGKQTATFHGLRQQVDNVIIQNHLKDQNHQLMGSFSDNEQSSELPSLKHHASCCIINIT